MFPSFIGILDIQSWWEVPSIAHFCSLFRAAFNLLDFDIEELEEALLTDGTEECASSLLTDLIVRLLCGCLGNNDISAFNYQMFLRRLFRQKCQETGRYNPFNTDIDFQFLPLRTKVEILYALCDFRLDADDVFELFKNLEAESLRVEPLGWDDNSSAYWYFYGTRLYREDYQTDADGEKKKRRRRRGGEGERIWQVVCFTEPDWLHLTDKFKSATSSAEKDLHLALSENFLPEIPRLFQEKERLQRKRLLESVPRRTSSRVQTKNKQKEEEEQQKQVDEVMREREIEELRERQLKGEIDINTGRENRAQRRDKIRMRSISPESSPGREDKAHSETSRAGPRRTNNSLASAILIPNLGDQPTAGDSTIRKLKSSQILALMEEDIQTDMYKVLEQIKCHEDAWPFMDPVEEDFAPNYYSVIRRPMDLQRIEDRLDQGYYKHFSMFKGDFNLIVNNCRLYNGQDNEYTEMVGHLETAFNKLTQRYFDRVTSSDDDIAVEYPVHNPSPRKAVIKVDRRVRNQQTENRKRKRNSSQDEESDESEEEKNPRKPIEKQSVETKIDEKDFLDLKKNKKHEKDSEDALKKSPTRIKKKNRSGNSKSEERLSQKKKKKLKYLKKSRKSRIEKHAAEKNRQKKKHSKYPEEKEKKKKNGWRVSSTESQESVKKQKDDCKISATSSKEQVKAPEIDFYKDKYDKIKERRRGMLKSDWDLIPEKSKSNFPIPEKDKNIKLKETIEKLKAKSEKNNENISIFDDMFRSAHKKKKRLSDELDLMAKKTDTKAVVTDEYEFVDDLNEMNTEHTVLASQNKVNTTQRKVSKKHLITKNESATEALEQAVKDINDWLVDTPKLSEFESNSNSPLQDVSPDDFLLIPPKHEEDALAVQDKDKIANLRKDMTVKKRLTNKDVVKVPLRRKEVQRTIDRLQPGKGKGNLIANIQSTSKQEDSVLPLSSTNKSKEVKNSLIVKTEEGSPKLSLGTVLATVGFGLGKQHNFTNETNLPAVEKEKEVVVPETSKSESTEEETVKVKESDEPVEVVKTVEEDIVKADDDISSVMSLKQCQEKATPNLSAWFKAFGAPKSGSGKKKLDESDQDDSKSNDVTQLEGKSSSPINHTKGESSVIEEIHSIIPEGGESPLPSAVIGSRPRRTSTGSSISERSSFSQDLDSPRHPSHSSPLLRSPASPRMEDHQKAYPPLNGTVRVGFYQDTASVKSSPEKSCSPRDAPQSPYAAYSQHVYAAASSSAPNAANQALIQSYGNERPKSPIPYYETNKISKSQRPPDDYPAFGAESAYQQPSSFAEPFSPVRSPYSHHSQHSPYSQVQHSPQTFIQPTVGNNPSIQDSRTFEKTTFPVKKRMYNMNSQTSMAETSTISTPALVRKTEREATLNEKQPYLGSKQNMNTATEASTYDSQRVCDTNISDSSRGNAASVITSTTSETAQKTTLQYAQSPKSSVIEVDVTPLTTNSGDSIIQNVSSKSQYPDNISSTEYSTRKSQYKFSNVRIESPFVQSDTAVSNPNVSEHLQNPNIANELKNIVLNAEFAQLNKPVDMVNMGYSTKLMDASKINQQRGPSDLSNLDNMMNMGFLMSECVNSENKLTHPTANKIESLNPDLSASHKGFEMYMASSIAGRSDTSRHQQSKSGESIKPGVLFSEISRDLTLKQNFGGCTFSSDESAKNCIPNYIEWHMEMGKNAELQNKIDNTKQYSSSADILSASVGIHKSKGESVLSMYNSSSNEANNEPIQRLQPELRIPIIRPPMSSMMKPDCQKSDVFDSCNIISGMHPSKAPDITGSSTALLNTSLQSFKTQQHSHSTLSTDSAIRNMPNHSQLMERCAKDERALSGFQPPSSSVYHNKTIPLTHLYPKNVHTSTHNSSTSNPIFPTAQMSMAFSRENMYPTGLQHVTTIQSQPPLGEKTSRSRKKKSALEISAVPVSSNQSFHSYQRHKTSQPPISEQSAISLKTANVVPGSAFNFGPPGSVGNPLNSSVYSDPNFLEEIRNSNPYLNANYIAAVAAAHQRNTPERSEKCVKPVHQSVPHNPSNPYQFPAHTPGYPFMGLDHSSPLYQPYLMRRQEELLHSGSRNIGILPPGYSSLGVRQSFDSITRPSWL